MGAGSSRVGHALAATVILLLLAHVSLLACGAWTHSPTLDEVAHFAAGLSHWHLGRFELARVNPPLVRMVGTAPVLLAQPKVKWNWSERDFERRGFAFDIGEVIIRHNQQRIRGLFTLARLGCLPLTLFGAWVCMVWARELHGKAAAICALSLWCFSPTILAHAQLITADVGAAAMGLAAGYAFWRWLIRPTWAGTTVAGLCLGLAQLTKATWIILYLLWPLLWLVWRAGHRSGVWGCRGSERPRGTCWAERVRFSQQLWQMGLLVFLSLYVLNLGYGFEGSFQRLGDYEFMSKTLGGDDEGREGSVSPKPGNRFRGTWLGRLPVPLPKNYVSGIDWQKWDFERRMWSYLRGEWRLGGWWYYYLYALAVKVPVGTWVLGALALFLTCTDHRYRAGWRNETFLLAPAVAVIVLVSSQTGFNHHMRYVLPAFPFLFIWISKVGRAFELGDRRVGAIVAFALVWTVGSSLWVYPHSLSYFNELAGGPRNGHEHLLDSNIDWGQDFFYLKGWVEGHPEARPLVVRYWPPILSSALGGVGSTRRASHGATPEVDAQKWQHHGAVPGWFAVSIRMIRDCDTKYRYFLELEPVATAGYSIYIYHVTVENAERIRRKSGVPWSRIRRREARRLPAAERPSANDRRRADPIESAFRRNGVP